MTFPVTEAKAYTQLFCRHYLSSICNMYMRDRCYVAAGQNRVNVSSAASRVVRATVTDYVTVVNCARICPVSMFLRRSRLKLLGSALSVLA